MNSITKLFFPAAVLLLLWSMFAPSALGSTRSIRPPPSGDNSSDKLSAPTCIANSSLSEVTGGVVDDDDHVYDDEDDDDDEEQKKDKDNFSFAIPVVAERAVASESRDCSYHEPLAKLFAGEAAIRNVRAQQTCFFHAKNGHSFFKKYRNKEEINTVVARHMMIDQLLHDASPTNHQPNGARGPRQVVILGAGFDSRAHRFEYLSFQKWFEIDLPAPQEYKEKILRQHGVPDPENLTRIALDLTTATTNDDDWIQALERAGWDPTAPTVYILEGLIYYLSTEQAKKLLASIPSVPASRIIVTIIEQSVQRDYERRLGPCPFWKTNLRKLQKARALNIPNYVLRRDVAVPTPPPQRVTSSTGRSRLMLAAGYFWHRLSLLFHWPCERILEFEAV